MGADLVRMAMAAGEVSLARQVAAVVGDVASRHDAAWLRGAALRCQGLAADDPGLLEAAALAYADASRPLELALAAEAAAVAYVELGETQRARPLLDQAIATYERLNAARDLARADAILREMGVRRGIRGDTQAAPVRLAEPDAHRTHRGGSGRRRIVQPADRRPPVHLAADRPDPSRAHVRKTGHLLPRPACRRSGPARAGKRIARTIVSIAAQAGRPASPARTSIG